MLVDTINELFHGHELRIVYKSASYLTVVNYTWCINKSYLVSTYVFVQTILIVQPLYDGDHGSKANVTQSNQLLIVSP